MEVEHRNDVPTVHRIGRFLRRLPLPHRLSQRVQWSLLWLTVACYLVMVGVELAQSRSHELQSSQCGPHRPELSVDLPDSLVSHGVKFPPEAVWRSGGRARGCPCLIRKCFRLCNHWESISVLFFWSVMEPGQTFWNSSKVFTPRSDQYRLHGPPDCRGRLGMFGATYRNLGEVSLMVDGRVMTDGWFYLDVNDYCLKLNEDGFFEAITCVEVAPLQRFISWDIHMPPSSHGVALFSSLVATGLTIAVHLYLPQLRTLHGKLLVGFLLFFCVNYTQFLQVHDRWPMSMEYLWQYSYLGCVCWFSTIGFDVWLLICGPVKPYNLRREGVLLFRYCLFACGCPSVLCGLTWATSVIPYRSDSCPRPRFQDDSCTFTKERVTSLFYHMPIVVFAVLNLSMYLFMLYSLKIHPKPPCTSPQGHAALVAKQGFKLYTKLSKVLVFCVVLLLLVTMPGVENGAPTYRLLVLLYFSQGIFIFVVLCCNTKIFKFFLQKRLEVSISKHLKEEGRLDEPNSAQADPIQTESEV